MTLKYALAAAMPMSGPMNVSGSSLSADCRAIRPFVLRAR